MARRTRKKTLADYVVIAISPVLIMTLVGSLAFFLLELTYHGQFELRMKWILFWFVLAAVLVARIAIEQGKDYASLFGLALTAAVALAVVRLVDQILLGWTLLGVTWWCTWKLTWDCTLIDDREDASGEGLLQAAGLDAAASLDAGADAKSAAPSGAERRSVHAPGRWVVYFSLAALPLFGAGQLVIPSRDTAARAYGFNLLAVYVASALGLLLTTSFLGLRRYLRQRKLQMPTAITRSWLLMGAGLALAILCLALLLPQPQGEYSVTALVDKVDTKLREASRFAVVPGDRAKGEGRRIGDQDPKADKPGESPPRNQPPDQQGQAKPGEGGRPGQKGQGKSSDNQQQDKSGGQSDSKEKGKAQGGDKSDDKGQGGDKSDDKGQGGKKSDDQAQGARRDQGQNRDGEKRQPADGQKATPSPSAPSGSALGSLMQFLAAAFKWLIYGAIAVAAVVLLMRHWSRVMEILAKFWADLLAAFGRKRGDDREASAEGGAAPAAVVRFAAFENPFFTGTAGRMPPAQLVRYTFEALEAWARERVVARPPEQTPLEFAQELGRRDPALAKDVTSTAELYVRVAYARKNPSRESVAVLERLWRRMGMGTDA
jgi:Domain of unknown function (DUF4129)